MTFKTKLLGIRHLLRSYTSAIPYIAYRSTVSLLVDPRGTQEFVHQVLNARDLEADDPVLGSTTICDLFPGTLTDVEVVGPYYAKRSADTRLLMEVASLARLVQALRPSIVFEIGTFVGRTTRLLARNSPQDCRVLTLDLPQDQVSHRIGEAFCSTTEAKKITQFFCDSKTFNYHEWHGKCDFVWVDACHDYDYVLADTSAAFKLCRPGGWIGWHDYRHSAWWSGVTRCVREVQRSHPSVRHIRGTTIALLNLGSEYR